MELSVGPDSEENQEGPESCGCRGPQRSLHICVDSCIPGANSRHSCHHSYATEDTRDLVTHPLPGDIWKGASGPYTCSLRACPERRMWRSAVAPFVVILNAVDGLPKCPQFFTLP